MGFLLQPRCVRLLATLLAAVTALSEAAAAQQFGRWWWDGFLGAGMRSYENRVDGAKASSLTERQLRVSLGLNGYLGHPALGRFRVGVDGLRNDLSGPTGSDSDQLGYSVDLDLLPQGSYPISVGARRTSIDLTPGSDATTSVIGAQLETTESFFARLGMRRGWLRGAQLQFNRNRLEFLDPELAPEHESATSLRWVRRIGAFDNRLRLDRELHDYSLANYSTDVWTGSFDQFARLATRWGWQLSLSGHRFGLEQGAKSLSRGDEMRSRASLSREVRGRDLAQLQFELGLVRPSGQIQSESYSGTLSYRLSLRPSVNITPFVQTAELSGEETSRSAQRGGVSFSWSRASHVVDALLSGTAAYGMVSSTDLHVTSDETQRSWAVAASLEHGDLRRTRAGLELEVAINQIRIARPESEVLQDPSFLETGTADEDFARARLKLERRRGTRGLALWADVSKRRSTPLDQDRRVDFTASTITAQASRGSFTLTASGGRTESRPAVDPRQVVEFASTSVSWRPARSLSLLSSYRYDLRSSTALPDLRGSRLNAGFVFHLGQLDLRGEYWQTTDKLASGTNRRDSGFSWTLGRRMAGWLPIVTGARRRGEIR